MPRADDSIINVWPKLGFHEQREIWPPMVKKATDETRNIERNELMDHLAWKALLGQPTRCDCAGGH